MDTLISISQPLPPPGPAMVMMFTELGIPAKERVQDWCLDRVSKANIGTAVFNAPMDDIGIACEG